MKQRIRGLVSLHEIPFSSRALQREEGNWPHYRKSRREGGVEGGGSRKQQCSSFLSTALHDCCPTCDTIFITFIWPYFPALLVFLQERERIKGEKNKNWGTKK